MAVIARDGTCEGHGPGWKNCRDSLTRRRGGDLGPNRERWSPLFFEAVTGSIDASKLPAAEVITKHLSPIICSQKYERDGYLAESIGPITLDQLGIGLAILSSFGAPMRQIGSSPARAAIPPTTTPTLTP